MSRWEYDGLFYRVFCASLLILAFTFTVILTNVFIDIDGLLTNKKKAETQNDVHQVNNNEAAYQNDNSETFYSEDRNFEDSNDVRTKRSLDSQNFLFHIKNPKIKNIITNRLSTLLQELDEEESKKKEKGKSSNEVITTITDTDGESRSKLDESRSKVEEVRVNKEEKNDDMLHLAMHNILLEGIIGHKDLNEVYKKVHSLIKDYEKLKKEDSIENPKPFMRNKELKQYENIQNPTPSIENKFLEELTSCKTLKGQILDQNEERKRVDEPLKPATPKAPKVLIKTIIDIKSNRETNKLNDTSSRENVRGLIRLIYNGKSINFNRMEDEQLLKNIKTNAEEMTEPTTITINYPKRRQDVEMSDLSQDEHTNTQNTYINKVLSRYLDKYPANVENYSDSTENKKVLKKRLKRHIKVSYDESETTHKSVKQKNNDDDDELYVEIETHFDNKGMKGEKKKKLIRSLIDKIQKAIHSDTAALDHGKKKKHKHFHVKKRVQNPLEHNHKDLEKILQPNILKRQLNPISKSVKLNEPLPNVFDKSGEAWKKSYKGPGFLTPSKSLNSAELADVDVDYNKVMTINGIPQRLQKPLSTDSSSEITNANTYMSMGNVKFFIKDIDGSGFSIGFNQYVDEPPDEETMKVFTGLENIIQKYHQNYDQTEAPAEITNDNNNDEKPVSNFNNHEVIKRDTLNLRDENNEERNRGSFDDNNNRDYHSNEYKIIFKSSFLPYDSYQEIYEDKKKKIAVTLNKQINNDNSNKYKIITKDIKIKELPVIIDDNIFKKDLNPAEIFGLANLLDRKKRSVKVKHISNLNTKFKLNRYINTSSMKKIIMNKKRNKRQIDKIRIIATDHLPNLPKRSEEDIFVVSDENVFADRAIVREVVTPEVIDIDKGNEEQYDNIPPNIYEEHPMYVNNMFENNARHNSLMSKYPHIIEMTKSKEEYVPDNSVLSKLIGNPFRRFAVPEEGAKEFVETTTIKTTTVPTVQEIVNAIAPPTNYKLTLKIMPKNVTVNSGFKEVHTSINKSFNKNGLLYSSLMNVSQISQVVKLNKTKNEKLVNAESPSHIKEEKEKMSAILKQHKAKIEAQLEKLRQEKEKLDTIIVSEHEKAGNRSDDMDIILPLDPPQVIHLSKDDVSKIVANALRIPQIPITTTAKVTTTTEPITTTTIKTSTIDPEKTKIMDGIQSNQNLTNEILKKLDKNTEILQMFLQKLTDKNEATTRKLDIGPAFRLKEPFQPVESFFGETMPNLEAHKNDTHVSIPFVYAYQQPFSLPNKSQPVASVVYHGHIHTNALTKPNDWKTIAPAQPNLIKRELNQTRFFIDELENEYKVVPIDVKKDSLNKNATNV